MIRLKTMAQIATAAEVVEVSFAYYRARDHCRRENPLTVPTAKRLTDAERDFNRVVRGAIQEIQET